MRRRLTCAVLLAVFSATLVASHLFARAQQAAPPPAQEQAPPIVTEVRLVDVIFTVLNRRQRFVTDLGRDNFKVFEDGEPQDIRFFSRQTDLPLRVGMLLDTSNSIRDRLKFEQEAAIDFFYSTLRRNKDLAFLMTFDNEPSVIEEYIGDLDRLRDTINRQRAGGGTALYDGVYFACNDRLAKPPMPPGPTPEVRRVLLLISDGDDTHSNRAKSEAIEACQRAGVVIYAISTSTQWVTATEAADPTKRVNRKIHKEAGDKTLDQLTEETGGRAFFPYRLDDLGQSFQDIGDELRSQYSLAYVPQNKSTEGTFRKIKIEVDRKGLIVRARKGYYTPRTVAITPTSTRPPGQ